MIRYWIRATREVGAGVGMKGWEARRWCVGSGSRCVIAACRLGSVLAMTSLQE